VTGKPLRKFTEANKQHIALVMNGDVVYLTRRPMGISIRVDRELS